MKNKKPNTVGIIIGLMWIALLVKCVFTAWGGNYLYADGANFCYGILNAGNWVNAFEGRTGSFWLMELPMVWAIKLGVKDIRILCALFGSGSVVWLGLFSVLAMHLCKKNNEEQYVAGIAILYAMVNIFSGFFTQIESITAVGIFVYLFYYYLLARKNEDWGHRVLAALLLIVLPCANEYFVVFAFSLAAAIVLRFIRDRKSVYWLESLIHLGVVVYTFIRSYDATVNGYSTGSLMGSIRALPGKRYYWIIMVLLVITLVTAVIGSKCKKKSVQLLGTLARVVCSIGLAYVALRNPAGLAALSFSMRFMNLVLPMAFAVLCLGLWWFRVDIKSLLSIVAICFLIVNSIYTAQSSVAYHDYVVQMHEASEGRTGFFCIDETDINRTFCWGWPLPMEGFLAQCIQGETVIDSILVYDYDPDFWEQFPSDDINAYADFSRYGVVIDKQYFQK